MHYKLIKKDGKVFVLSVRKTISISLLWLRYMWLVVIAGLLPVGGDIVVCVFSSTILFSCFCWFPGWVFG